MSIPSLNATGYAYTDLSINPIDGGLYKRYVFTDISNNTKSIQISGYSTKVYYYIFGGGSSGEINTYARGNSSTTSYIIGGRGGSGGGDVSGNIIVNNDNTINITVGSGGGSMVDASNGVLNNRGLASSITINSTTYSATGGNYQSGMASNDGGYAGYTRTDIFGNKYIWGCGGGKGGNYNLGYYCGGGGGGAGGKGGLGRNTFNDLNYVSPGGDGGPYNITGGAGGAVVNITTTSPSPSNNGNNSNGGGGGAGASTRSYSGIGGSSIFYYTTNYSIIAGGGGGGGNGGINDPSAVPIYSTGAGSQGFVVLIIAIPPFSPTNVIASQLSYPAESPIIVKWADTSNYGAVTNYKITAISSDNNTIVTTNNTSGRDTSFNYTTFIKRKNYIFNVVAQFVANSDSSYNSSLPAISNTLNVVCFKEGTKILTDKGYITIENLRKGDLVQTIKNGYKPITMIGKQEIYHNSLQQRIKDQLYVCSNNEYPELFEDLVITGCHSILIDEFKEGERQKVFDLLRDIYVTEEKYRLPACLDERAKVYDVPGKYYVYHFSLEHEFNKKNYGVYANGLLVECCSKRYITEYTKMEIIE